VSFPSRFYFLCRKINTRKHMIIHIHTHIHIHKEIKLNLLYVRDIQDLSSLSQPRYHLERIETLATAFPVPFEGANLPKGVPHKRAWIDSPRQLLSHITNSEVAAALKERHALCIANPGRSWPRQLYTRRPNIISTCSVAVAMNLARVRHGDNAITQRGDNVPRSRRDKRLFALSCEFTYANLISRRAICLRATRKQQNNALQRKRDDRTRLSLEVSRALSARKPQPQKERKRGRLRSCCAI